jgi:hypothetical protein
MHRSFLRKKLHWSGGWTDDPVNILARVEPYIGSHRGEKCVLVDGRSSYADLLALQVPNAVDMLTGE